MESRESRSNRPKIAGAAASILAAALAPGGVWAGGPHGPGDFSFVAAGCVQTVSNIQAPAERVKPYMDPRFECSREDLGSCMVAYRMFSCPEVSIDGGPARAILFTEFGVRAKPPNGIPNLDHVDTHAADGHDYYMLFFHTNDEELAQRFADAGAPASYVPDLALSLPANRVPNPLEGTEIEPGGGTYQVTAQALLRDDLSILGAEVILQTGAFPPFHLNAYHVRPDGHIVRYQELRTNVTGHFSSYRIAHSEETLLAEMTGRTETTYGDAVVFTDIDGTIEVFEAADCVFDPSCNPANRPSLPLP